MSSVPAIHVVLEGTDRAYRLEESPRKNVDGFVWSPPPGSATWISVEEMRNLSGVKIRAHFESEPLTVSHGVMRHVRQRPRGASGSKQVGPDGKRKPWRERTVGHVELTSSGGVYAKVEVSAIIDHARGEAKLVCTATQRAVKPKPMTPARREQKLEEQRWRERQKRAYRREEVLRRREWLSLGETAERLQVSKSRAKKILRTSGEFPFLKRDRYVDVHGKRLSLEAVEKYGAVYHVAGRDIDAYIARHGLGHGMPAPVHVAKKYPADRETVTCGKCGSCYERIKRPDLERRPDECEKCRCRAKFQGCEEP